MLGLWPRRDGRVMTELERFRVRQEFKQHGGSWAWVTEHYVHLEKPDHSLLQHYLSCKSGKLLTSLVVFRGHLELFKEGIDQADWMAAVVLRERADDLRTCPTAILSFLFGMRASISAEEEAGSGNESVENYHGAEVESRCTDESAEGGGAAAEQ